MEYQDLLMRAERLLAAKKAQKILKKARKQEGATCKIENIRT